MALTVGACGVDHRGLGTNGAAGSPSPGDGTGGDAGASGGSTGTGGFIAPSGSGGGGGVNVGTGGAHENGGGGKGGFTSLPSGGHTGSGGVMNMGGGDVVPGSGGNANGGAGGAPDGDTGGNSGGAAGADRQQGGAGQGGAAGSADAGGAVGTGGIAPGTGGAVGTGGVEGTGGATGTGGRPACDATTCRDGCCSEGACVTTRTNERCGTGGVACAACAGCFRCGTTGSCEVSPTSSWKLLCSSAVVSATKAGGAAWDPVMATMNPMAGLADPICELTLNQMTVAMTSVQMNTSTPTWNESITPPSPALTASLLMSQATPWSIFVGDDDGSLAAESICKISPQLASADFAAGNVTFSNVQLCTSVSIRLVCMP
jgi:hypothetical protein